MNDLKKKVSLLLVLIMVFSLFSPFSNMSLRVEAAVRMGDLSVSYEWKLEVVPNMPSPRLSRITGPELNNRDRNALLSWAIPQNNSGIYVLRFFDVLGQRNELTVLHLDPDRLMVNFDSYRGIANNGQAVNPSFEIDSLPLPDSGVTGYRNLLDPQYADDWWRDAQYQISTLEGPYLNARNYFNLNHNGDEADDPVTGDEVMGRRVNNRPRYDDGTPSVYGNPNTTATYSNYPVGIFNDDPLLYDIEGDPRVTDDGLNHFNRLLTPSFNINRAGTQYAQGEEGFSFRYNHMTVHFLWDRENVFHVYIENGFTQGNIYAFDLEHHVGSSNVASRYHSRDVATLVTDQSASQTNAANFSTTRYYVFPGIRFSAQPEEDPRMGDILAFPYAQNIAGPDPDYASYPPNPFGIPDGERIDHTLVYYINNENDSLEGTVGTDYPYYDTKPIYMPGLFNAGVYDPLLVSAVEAAKPSNGFDIRFNLPRLYDEETGTYTVSIEDYNTIVNPGSLPDLRARVHVGNMEGTTDTESFAVIVDLSNLEAYNPANYWRDGGPGEGPTQWDEPGAPQIDPASPHRFEPARGNNSMILHDVSILHRKDQPQADRVRIKVGNLQPSVLHEFAQVEIFSPVDTNYAWLQTSFANATNPLTTFLDIQMIPIGDSMYAQVTPYNFYVGSRRTGDYQMRTGESVRGGNIVIDDRITVPQVGNSPLLFKLNNSGYTVLNVVHHSNIAGMPLNSNQFGRSQIIVWNPSDVPPISIPSNFTIVKDGSERHYSLTPQFPPYRYYDHPDVTDLERENWDDWGRWIGDLNFWTEWDIGTTQNIRDLVNLSIDNSVTVDYVLSLSRAPDTNDPSYEDYLHVRVHIYRDPSSNPLTGTIWVEYEAWFPDGMRDENDELVNPIVNTERQPLRYRMNPVTGEDVNYVAINILTDAIHLYRPVQPPPPFVRNDFRFPNVYFMNTRLIAYRYEIEDPANPGGTIIVGVDDNGGTGNAEAAGWNIPSLFDYIVVDDISELQPPAPANVTVTADTRPDTPPTLTVNYNIPLEALRTYFHNGSPVYPLITVDMYIGQFEDSMMETFFYDGIALEPELRISERPNQSPYNSYVYDYNWEDTFAPDDPAAFGYVDMSGASVNDDRVQGVLRGEDTDVPTGIVRISNIPILRNVAAVNDDGTMIPLGTPLYAPLDAPTNELEAAIASINEILYPGGNNPPSTYAQSINLTNLDENRRYYVFMDLVVHRFVSGSALGAATIDGTPVNPNDLYPYPEARDDVSGLSNVSAGTTVGTPIITDPSDIAPPAPRNVRAPMELRGQTAASILWDPYFPAASEEGVRIEWEMIRIRDGVRMTSEQMQMRNVDFAGIYNNQINSTEKFGWFTDTAADRIRNLTVLPGGEVITMPDPEERYIFDFDHLTDISFRDQTLSPNHLYFYYIRTVRIVTVMDSQLGEIETRAVSTWVELPVTTFPVTAPENLRVEDGEVLRPGMDTHTQVLVSWEHADMSRILDAYGTDFEFQYRIRESEEEWMEITTVAVTQMLDTNLDPNNPDRIRYMVSGLEPITVYQMQVRLHDVVSDDNSLWSNTITFVTEFDGDDYRIREDVQNWLDFINRELQKLLRNPYWLAQNTPTSAIIVYRPDDVFATLRLESPGAMRLYNTDAANTIIYMPAANILEANEHRKGFSTLFSDLELLFAPSFINPNYNQAVMDMIRAINARDSGLSDYYVRFEIQRTPMTELFDVPAITRQTNLSVSLVATNDRIRNISRWDRDVTNRAIAIVNGTTEDPVMRQNIENLLLDGLSNEEMLDYVDVVIQNVANQIAQMISVDLNDGANGILSDRTETVTEFDAAMHVIVTTADEETSVNAFRHINGEWARQDTIEYYNGYAITSRTPGTFAFTGRRVDIPGIENVMRGNTVTSIVARHGLEDLFGLNIDLEQYANRQMVIGAMARIAGAPHNADLMAWAVANLNVTLTSRNATGLISSQEAVAVVMAVYESRTNSPVDTILIRNYENTAGMDLHPNYAQAVRAAFELGIVTNPDFDPNEPITIGDFLNILAELTSRIPI